MKQENKNLWGILVGSFALLIIIYSIVVVKLVKNGFIKPENEISSMYSTSKSDNKVAILKIEGAIFRSESILKKIRKIRKKKTVKSVVLRLNSPGGGVGASQEIFEEIKKLNKEKPVVISIESIAASGAYYIAVAGKTIFANRGSITGSIGVIMQLAYLKDLYKFFKYKPITIKSGKYKDMGSPNRELTKEERVFFQSLSDELHKQFIDDVATQRHIPLNKMTKLAQGQAFTGSTALKLGLIDKIGTYEDAIMYAAKLAKITDGYPKLYIPKIEKEEKGLSLNLNSIKSIFLSLKEVLFSGQDVYSMAR